MKLTELEREVLIKALSDYVEGRQWGKQRDYRSVARDLLDRARREPWNA